MPKRNILLLDKEESPWPSFLEEFFNDTSSQLYSFTKSSEASQFFSKHTQDLALVNDALLSPALIQKLKVQRQMNPQFRIFAIQMDHPPVQFSSYDSVFTEPLEFLDFHFDYSFAKWTSANQRGGIFEVVERIACPALPCPIPIR